MLREQGFRLSAQLRVVAAGLIEKRGAFVADKFPCRVEISSICRQRDCVISAVRSANEAHCYYCIHRVTERRLSKKLDRRSVAYNPRPRHVRLYSTCLPVVHMGGTPERAVPGSGKRCSSGASRFQNRLSAARRSVRDPGMALSGLAGFMIGAFRRLAPVSDPDSLAAGCNPTLPTLVARLERLYM